MYWSTALIFENYLNEIKAKVNVCLPVESIYKTYEAYSNLFCIWFLQRLKDLNPLAYHHFSIKAHT